MAQYQNFRTALNGFNRQDVVNYIEYINQKHAAQIEQLNTQLQNVREELQHASPAPAADTDLQAQLDQALARCAQLEAQLSGTPDRTELEAYRRAERTERRAQERSAQIYARANAVLAEATAKVEKVSQQIGNVVDEITEKLQSSRQEMQDAVDAMYAIRPEEE